MKKLFVTILLLFLCIGLKAQVIEFKDSKFKEALLQADASNYIATNESGVNFKIDTNSNGEIEIEEALQVFHLDIEQKTISNIEEIKFFSNLVSLRCPYNNLGCIDTSGNLKLQSLSCFYNNITYLDLSKNLDLISVECSGNKLVSLDVSNNLKLRSLELALNQVTEINISKNIELETFNCAFNLIKSIDASNNTKLNDLYLQNNKLEYLNVKNSKEDLILTFEKNPTLKQICADESRISILQNQASNFYGYKDVVVTADCEQTLSTDLHDFSIDFSVYPNPVINIINIETNSNILSLAIYNQQGQIVQTVPQVTKMSFDVSHLPKGIYIVKVKTDKGETTTKIVKE